MTETGLWRITVDAAARAASMVEAALEPFCDSVSSFGDDDDRDRRIVGLARHAPDRAAVDVALALAAACRGVAVPNARIEPLTPRDWLADNEAAFPPFAVGRWFVHGAHVAQPVPPGRIGLLIDAGSAFGSGRHGSTEGCLRALDALAGRRFERALDMGCGSGILAIAMAKRWRVAVLAVDADREAVAVTGRNARRNRVGGLVRTLRAEGYRHPDVCAPPPFDLIVCNILARPIRAMAADLVRRLRPAGVAVLSGFLEREAGGVLSAHRAQGLRLWRRLTVDGWRTLVLIRRG
ncbi:MAG: 50S ribosomal protein L11 methyltransferase [Rhodospirillales bacterium]